MREVAAGAGHPPTCPGGGFATCATEKHPPPGSSVTKSVGKNMGPDYVDKHLVARAHAVGKALYNKQSQKA